MTRPAPALLLLISLAATSPAEPGPAPAGQARAVILSTVDTALAVMHDPALSSAERRKRIEQIAYDHFDFETMSRLVLARNWKKLTPEQRREFVAEFREHLSLTYGRRLDEYSNETLEVGEAREEKNGDVTVQSVVRGGKSDGARLDYRMRQLGGEWKVIDVIIERVSLISNFRSQIQEIVSSEGPARVIEILREKNQRAEG